MVLNCLDGDSKPGLAAKSTVWAACAAAGTHNLDLLGSWDADPKVKDALDAAAKAGIRSSYVTHLSRSDVSSVRFQSSSDVDVRTPRRGPDIICDLASY